MNNYEFKSPKSGIRDLILSKSNNESSFQDLLKKSNTKEFKSIGNVSTNDRSRSSFKMNSNSDYSNGNVSTDKGFDQFRRSNSKEHERTDRNEECRKSTGTGVRERERERDREGQVQGSRDLV